MRFQCQSRFLNMVFEARFINVRLMLLLMYSDLISAIRFSSSSVSRFKSIFQANIQDIFEICEQCSHKDWSAYFVFLSSFQPIYDCLQFFLPLVVNHNNYFFSFKFITKTVSISTFISSKAYNGIFCGHLLSTPPIKGCLV